MATYAQRRRLVLLEDDFRWAAAQDVISQDQARRLWDALSARANARPRFDLAHVAYYFGALMVIGAMTMFMGLGWALFGAGGVAAIAIAYAACFATGGVMLRNRGLLVPGGLLVTMAVCMTPLIVYSIERATGWWVQGNPGDYSGFYEWVKGSWFPMELATLAAGLVAVRFVRFPFLTAPVAFVVWYMSMDLTPLLFGAHASWHTYLWVSLAFGLGLVGSGYAVDRLASKAIEDYAFWLYLFGLLCFWSGLTILDNGSTLGIIAYAAINVALILISVLLNRKTFTVFGGLGVFYGLSYLAVTTFHESLFFPFALTLLGLSIIFLAVYYQRHYSRIERFVIGALPPALRAFLPEDRIRHLL